MHRGAKLVVVMLALLLGGYLVQGLFVEPSNDRAWVLEQSIAPTAVFDGDRVLVRKVRDFRWSEEGAAQPGWYDAAYDLNELESVWYLVVPFREVRGGAHTFLSFGFSDGRYLAISVEARKERGETYSPFKGLFRAYELIYVIADERDAIGLRASVWNEDVYLYPVKGTPEKKRAALVDMLERANGLAARPEFYDTFRNSCTSNVVRHVNRVAPARVPTDPRTWLPAFSDGLALELGLLDVEGTLEEARARWRVTDRAREAAGHADFSARIRTPDGSPATGVR